MCFKTTCGVKLFFIAMILIFLVLVGVGATIYCVPDIVYTNVIVNVKLDSVDSATVVWTFDGRCDYFSDTNNANIVLEKCNATSYMVFPVCNGTNISFYNSYKYYGPGKIECPTNYLEEQFYNHVDLKNNLVNNIVLLLFIFAFILLIVIICLAICYRQYQKKAQRHVYFNYAGVNTY